jgi:pimeloyl-ACP methyl ester carboxylesterase
LPKLHIESGYFPSGLPFNRFGRGARTLIIFQGLTFENKPLDGLSARSYLGMVLFLQDEFTVVAVSRKPGLPAGYEMKDMAQDYADMVREEFGGPVDVMGTSTGGSIAQHFAADHPDLVRRLVIHSAAHTLGPVGREAQLKVGELARQGKWREASAVLLRLIVHPGPAAPLIVTLGSSVMSLSAPRDPSDLIITVEAEDRHAFRDRLGDIRAPTLVIAGADDPFYTEALFRETAAGIPGASLIMYSGMGHPAAGKQFEADLFSFLNS